MNPAEELAAENVAIVEMERQLARAKFDLKNEQAKTAAVYAELETEKARADFYDEVTSIAPTRRNWKRQELAPSGHTTAILVMTDWHVEQRVDRASTNGINEYTPKICERRARQAFERGLMLIQELSSFAKIDHVVVALLGDFLSGYIHPELEETNFMSPMEATLFSRDLIYSGLHFLLDESAVSRIDVACCQGNHGRTTQKRRVKSYAKNSYEWGLYQFLARESWPERLHWHITESYHNVLKVQGKTVRLHHGDNIRYGGGVGGITIPVNKAVAQWNKREKADLDLFGHWHHFKQDWNWVSCGCLVGYDEFAISIKADYQPPTQTLVLVSKKHGKVAALPIFVE